MPFHISTPILPTARTSRDLRSRQDRARRLAAVTVVGLVVAGLASTAALPAIGATVACIPNQVTVPIKVQFHGPYSSSLLHMTNGINSLGYVPALEPYAALGYPMRGGETNTAVLTDLTSANAPVDWLLVELRSAQDPTLIVATDTVMIGEDGLPVTAPTFAVKADNYYVAIEHRNHLGLMTAVPIAVGGTTGLVDFSSPTLAMYNNAPSTDGNRLTIGGVALMSGGEANHVVGALNHVDYGSASTTDSSAILARLGGNSSGMAYGYYLEDLSMNGIVRASGAGNDRNIILTGVLGGDANKIVVEQLPTGVLGGIVSCSTPVITSPATALAVTGAVFSFQLAAVGDPVMAFALAGTLPAGLAFDSATGVISGTATQKGTFVLAVTATNIVGSQQQALTLVVADAVLYTPVVSG